MRRWRLNSGYNATTDQRRTKAGTIPMSKHGIERDLGAFAFTTDPFYSSVSLLLFGDGTNGSTIINDNSQSPKTILSVGNSQISTAQSKFYGSSILFDGTGDYLTVTPTTDLVFDAGAFTVEFWFYANSLSATLYASFIGFNAGISTSAWGAYVRSNGVFMYGSAGTLTGGGTVSTSTWHHYAATRSGNTLRVFLNGVQQASATVTGNYISGGSEFRVGDDNDATNPAFNGYINDLRITKGVARYTANFTPPTQLLG